MTTHPDARVPMPEDAPVPNVEERSRRLSRAEVLRYAPTVDAAFALASSSTKNVQVIVVDVDRYGMTFLRDLRTVFPSVKLVAMSSSPRTLQQARRAGASATVSRKLSAARILKTIRGLAGLK